jgi:hypothetical protein
VNVRNILIGFFALGFVFLGILGKPLLQFIGSNADFPYPVLWAIMGLAMFAERYGAMHIQLRKTHSLLLYC